MRIKIDKSKEEKVLSDLKDIVEYFMRLYWEEEDRHIYGQHYDRMIRFPTLS